MTGCWTIQPIGVVRSPLSRLDSAPLQGDEGAPAAWVEIEPAFAPAMTGLDPGDEVLVLTWLNHARRDVVQTRPRRAIDGPLVGVFATRSPDRPNPVGLHRVRIVEVRPRGLKVAPIEAIDGTPVLDIKPVLAPATER